MKMIKASVLHVKYLEETYTTDIYINVDKILTVSVGNFNGEPCTKIELADQIINIKESVEEVLKLMEE